MIDNQQIYLAGLWTVLMLSYLLGDVLRLFSGDFKPGELSGVKAGQKAYLAISALMLIPILMIFLSLTADYGVNRTANMIVAIFFFAFNLIGLPTYPSAYDKFLNVVGLIFNVLTVFYAWGWV